jgi:hypothetical protein
MRQLRIDIQRRGQIQTFSWARVQPMGNGVQLALRIPRQVRTLGQVLAQQTISGAVVPIRPPACRAVTLSPLRVSSRVPPAVADRAPDARCPRPGEHKEVLSFTPQLSLHVVGVVIETDLSSHNHAPHGLLAVECAFEIKGNRHDYLTSACPP